MFCQQCGVAIEENSAFCSKCGAKQLLQKDTREDKREDSIGKVIKENTKNVIQTVAEITGPVLKTTAMTIISGALLSTSKGLEKKAGKIVNKGLKKAGLKKKNPFDNISDIVRTVKRRKR